MSMSIEQMYQEDEKRQAERAANKGNQKKFLDELKISKIGDSSIVQFCGVTDISDLEGAHCHVTHPVSKRTGNKYTTYVKCLSQDSEVSDSCPICKCKKEYTDNFGNVTKEYVRQYIVPIILVDLNMHWDQKKGEYVHDINSDKSPVAPTVKFIRKGFKKLLIKRIFEFVKANGDTTNKVIEIKAVAPKDGKGVGFDYDVSFINDIEPVDISSLNLPTDRFEGAQIISQTQEAMDRYVMTDSFYDNKDQNNNASNEETTQTENSEESTPEEDIANMAGVSFRKS